MNNSGKKVAVSFSQLIDAVRYNKYQLSSGKNVLELPLYFVLGKTFLNNFDDFLNKYKELLLEQNIGEDILIIVDNLNKGLRDTIDEYLKGDIMNSYSIFCNTMFPIKDILPRRAINHDKLTLVESENHALS